MPNFEIPEDLKNTLEQDYAMAGFVNTAVNEFGGWLEENNVKFFAEYTDHSLRHVEAVLKMADALIREECRGLITSPNVAVLIVAALLHDSAMHISIDGFITLIQSDNDYEPIAGFGDKQWSILWREFWAEARRFSGRKLMAMFGDTEPVEPPPLDDPQKMTRRDLLLIGEFLRRHHHRLAHEIALYGVPGPNADRLHLKPAKEIDHMADVAGLIARGHRLPLRDTYDYLEKNYGSKTQIRAGIYPIFMMALLRIADELQIEDKRAPRYVHQLRELKSPISQGEWAMHQAIENVNINTNFSETVEVFAKPSNVKTYLRVRQLLDKIQRELDTAWTVIGEVYGFNRKYEALGFKIRRIRSNLDELESFAEGVDYVPTYAAFEAADTDLLKLLIGPLYGEKPEIGIRELMQNSLDAVRELQEYLESHPEIPQPELTEQAGEVLISLDMQKDDCGWVTISDQGIGMTVETIRDYFLKVGASLRRSEIWRKTFEDNEGNSTVLRSGRFGIGALAAYLLGNEIEVSTRHVSASSGLQFIARLDTEMIELKHFTRPVGTTIRIRVNQNVGRYLIENSRKWDWFCLENPVVVCQSNEDGFKLLDQGFQLPAVNASLPKGWYRLQHTDYKDIQWTFSKAPVLTCNGIRVIEDDPEEFRRNYRRLHSSMIQFSPTIISPNISVFDSDAKLPLNLQRTSVTTNQWPFDEALLPEVIKDCIASLLVTMPKNPVSHSSEVFDWYSRYLPSAFAYQRNFGSIDVGPWYSAQNGLGCRLDRWHLNQLDYSSSINIYVYYRRLQGSIFPLNLAKNLTQIVFPCYLNPPVIKRESIALDTYFDAMLYNQGEFGRPFEKMRVLVSHHVIHEHYSRTMKSDSWGVAVLEEWQNENWVLLRLGDCPSPEFDFERFATENSGKNFHDWPCILSEQYFDKEKREMAPTPFSRAWQEYVGSPLIPLAPEERRSKLAYAYEVLKPYIDTHLAMKEK